MGNRDRIALPHIEAPVARPVSGVHDREVADRGVSSFQAGQRREVCGLVHHHPSTVASATSWSATTSGPSDVMTAPMRPIRSRDTCRHQAGGNGPGPIAARML